MSTARRFWLACTVLAAQSALLLYAHREEMIPEPPSLVTMPDEVGPWKLVDEEVLPAEVLENLKPDAYVNRTFRSPDSMANLFVAYFNSQRDGRLPHSPKNCLPGAGWLPVWRRQATVKVPGTGEIMPTNHFLIAKGLDEMMVYYLYLTSRRAIASDYGARIFLALDAIEQNRTDTMLVRMIVPVRNGRDVSSRRLAEFAGPALAEIRKIYRE